MNYSVVLNSTVDFAGLYEAGTLRANEIMEEKEL